MSGPAAIRARWSSLPRARDDIEFGYEILAVTKQWGIARWRGSYTPAAGGAHLELDGMLLISLDDEGRCRDFREWSNRRERPVA